MTLYPVTLFVYDISNGLARQMSPMIVGKLVEGIWHTSIVVHNKEYYFQGGVYGDDPKTTPFGNPVKEIVLGTTELNRDDIEQYIDGTKEIFLPQNYDIFKNNCNHYSNHLSEFLLGHHIPSDYLHQAQEFENTPIGSFIKSMNETMKDQVVSNHISWRQNAPTPMKLIPKDVVTINDELEYIQFISGNPKCVVDFGATWCGPCKMIKPIYESFANQYKGRIAFAAVDTDSAKEVGASLNVTGLPTFVFLFNDKEVKRVVGANQSALREGLEYLASLK